MIIFLTAANLRASKGQFLYTTENGSVTITGYNGPGGSVLIPATIDNLPVARIGDFAFASNNVISGIKIQNGPAAIGEGAFANCPKLLQASLSKSITSVAARAFASCKNLTDVYFEGTPPVVESDIFENSTQTTVFYPPATVDWTATFAGRPAIAWNPTISGGSFASDGHFTFRVAGNPGVAFMVEKAENSVNSAWTSVLSFRLGSGSILIKDLQSGAAPRFYRLRSP